METKQNQKQQLTKIFDFLKSRGLFSGFQNHDDWIKHRDFMPIEKAENKPSEAMLIAIAAGGVRPKPKKPACAKKLRPMFGYDD
jgi:hypothetical protein